MAGVLESLARDLIITEYSDWEIFVERLNEALRSGRIRRAPIIKPVWGTYEEWFLDPETGDVFVYLPPDDHGNPDWKKLDVLKHLEAPDPPDPPPLSIFKPGPITVMTGHVMKLKLEELVAAGLVDELTPPQDMSRRGTERRFKDKVSNITYRLTEYFGLNDPDDIRWEVVPQSELIGKVQ
jgi:hypothetical protein